MTIFTFRLTLPSPTVDLATRESGRAALRLIQDALPGSKLIELDFSQKKLTPSFADECLGGLVEQLGMTDFKSRIRLMNITDDDRPLIRHVVARRAQALA